MQFKKHKIIKLKISGAIMSLVLLSGVVTPTIILAQTTERDQNQENQDWVNDVHSRNSEQQAKENQAWVNDVHSRNSEQQAQPTGSEKTKDPVPTTPSSPPLTPEEQVVLDAASCSVGQIMGNAIYGVISGLIAGLASSLLSTELSVQDKNLRAKETGISINVFGMSVPLIPSWDSIAYCLVNTTIAYISNATIAWIRSGFEGNPAFVDNPGQFFQQVADFEYENFLDDIAGELLCEPFKINIINNLSTAYNQTPYDGPNGRGKCSLYDGYSGENVDRFLAGEYFDWDIWMNYTQVDANNPIGAELAARAELGRRISGRQREINIELDWGNGFLSWKDEETGNTITPGSAIQTQLANRLGLSEERLILADEFDEIISELVTYLIKTALNETFGAINN